MRGGVITTAAREENFNYRLWRYDGAPGELIPLLQSAQDHFGYIPRRAIAYIAGVTGVPESEVYGVITFYSQFRLQPMGKYVIKACDGTACHVQNSRMIIDTIEDELGVEVGGHDRGRPLHAEHGGLHRLLFPGAGDHDQRRYPRPADAAVGAQAPARVPAPRAGRGGAGRAGRRPGRGEVGHGDEKSHRGNEHLRPVRRIPEDVRPVRRAPRGGARRVRACRHGMHRHVLPGAARRGPGRIEPRRLRRRDAGARGADLPGGHPRGRRARGARRASSRAGRSVRRLRGPAPGAPGAHRAPQLRLHRSRVDRRVRGRRRVQGAPQGALRDDARRDRQGGQGLGLAGPRRRRIPHGPQVVVRRRAEGPGQVRRLQRGRGGPGRLHGPLGARGRPAFGHRGDDHRARRRSARTRGTSTAAPSTRWRSSA